jgi:magnesium transporter
MTAHVRFPDIPSNPGLRAKRLGSGERLVWNGQENKNLWLDLENPNPAELLALEQHFAINPLALEDAFERGHWSRFEVYNEHVFLIFRTLAEPDEVTDRSERVSIFYYPELHSLITIRNEPVTYLETVWQEVASNQCGPLEVMYALLQRGTDTFFAFLDALENKTDQLEERVFASKPAQMQRFSQEVFDLKHVLIAARRLASGAREGVAAFARHESARNPQSAMYLRDVSDHLTRVYDGLDSARDILMALLDVHLNVQSHRMNEVMKTLTTVSTIFLPLTFLAGVWGMNFEFMPELKQPWGYLLAWSVFVAVALALGWFFRRKGWW